MNYCDLVKRGLTFQQFHNHHNSKENAQVLKARLGWVGRYGQDAG